MDDTEQDQRFMRDALREARAAAEHQDVPVGAVVIAAGGAHIGRGHHRREADHDPTAHAEILALRDLAAQVGTWNLDGATLYVTQEPCPMCAGAIVNARIARVVFGCDNPKAGAVRTLFTLTTDPRLNHRATITAGVLAEESAALLKTFFATLRRP